MGTPSSAEIVTSLYKGILDREPDPAGFDYHVGCIDRGASLEGIIKGFVDSDEFRRSHAFLGAGNRDIVVKWVPAIGATGVFLALPATSADPIVQEYLGGYTSNDYMLDLLARTTSDGDSVVDLGCHVGTFSLGASAIGRRVTAVDAAPLHIRLMRYAKAINEFESLRIVHAAISVRPGFVSFIENGLFGAIDFSAKGSGTVEVGTRGLDEIVEAEGCAPVGFLKMDIEGAEYDALITGRRVFTEDRPVALFESNAATLRNAGHSIAEFRRLFETLGYRIFRVEGDRWIYSGPDQIQPESWVDMLALSEAAQREWASRIDWHWSPDAVLAKCRLWSTVPGDAVREHLLSEIRTGTYAPTIRDGMLRIAEDLAREA